MKIRNNKRKKLVEITGEYFKFAKSKDNWNELKKFIPALNDYDSNPLNPKEWAPIVNLNKFKDWEVFLYGLSSEAIGRVKNVREHLSKNNLDSYLHGGLLEDNHFIYGNKEERSLTDGTMKDIDIIAVGEDKNVYKVAENIKSIFQKQRIYKTAMQLEQDLQGIKRTIIQKIFLKNNPKFIEKFELKNPKAYEYKYGADDLQKSSYGCSENVTTRYILKESWLNLNPIDLAIMTKRQFNNAKNIGAVVD
ncbi:hypothetical protein KAT80_01560 [Candidatus Pacearchaeota archaeon]|nr:hypothetical protein [Candidatus Pacearchaeota archaeon]